MPQLAPLHWILLTLTFWLVVSLVASFLWWNQSPTTTISLSKNTLDTPRNWKW
uniref:ATP synthase complex subunit 8 n=1 Tax=Magelona mirabilis TaxID=46598 RepID=A0A0S2N0C7_9ANNE|nr:ATP synthase F0 subunit 8 [Magelona mirabilis]ALO81676.1 ATP synthase F0 subunit 8 [Magelona mirabilis]